MEVQVIIRDLIKSIPMGRINQDWECNGKIYWGNGKNEIKARIIDFKAKGIDLFTMPRYNWIGMERKKIFIEDSKWILLFRNEKSRTKKVYCIDAICDFFDYGGSFEPIMLSED
jgi:hypothetical protein